MDISKCVYYPTKTIQYNTFTSLKEAFFMAFYLIVSNEKRNNLFSRPHMLSIMSWFVVNAHFLLLYLGNR